MHCEESSELPYRISRGKKWGDEETQILIKHLEDNLSSLRGRGHHKAAVFERIARQLSTRGIHRTGKEVNNKYKSLRAKYREACSQLKRSGDSSLNFKWYQQLDSMLNGAEILAATPDSTDDSRLSVDIKESHHQKELRMVSTKQETETNFSVNGENHCSVGPQSVVELITINDDSFDATSNKKKSSDSLNETSTNQTVLPPLPDGDISQEDKRLQLGLLVKEIKEQSQASMMVQSRLCDSFANFTQLLGNLESTLSAMPVLVNQLIQQSQQQPYQQHQAANSIVLMPPSSQVVQPHYQQGFCSQFMLR